MTNYHEDIIKGSINEIAKGLFAYVFHKNDIDIIQDAVPYKLECETILDDFKNPHSYRLWKSRERIKIEPIVEKKPKNYNRSGQRNDNAKLTEQQVIDIKLCKYNNGNRIKMRRSLSHLISNTNFNLIWNEQRWRHIDMGYLISKGYEIKENEI